MKDSDIRDIPKIYDSLLVRSKEIGFNMTSDKYIGTLLKTLISSKPSGRFLELGTGIGLSLMWMIDGLGADSYIISVDNDPKLVEIAEQNFGADKRVEIVCADGSDWIKGYKGSKFDLIFADSWPGKYSEIDETMNLLNGGGFYVIDDMNRQPNWPNGHASKASRLISSLEERNDITLTKLNWSTGVIIATKIK
ncbi:O-methyltransferase [Spongiivirga citrea]|uniref:Methyltransferase domain-containing protein n=1 Tax=Spongiivirga citrea TaxID=1481457 RepID=A0A6M0CPG0_9FLAO|nr:class I SAM-dependent methyltransferase [Spongiivirga citrea]NER18823.1 methyltransferase domain-containing protein [Spongiivirga citrea]